MPSQYSQDYCQIQDDISTLHTVQSKNTLISVHILPKYPNCVIAPYFFLCETQVFCVHSFTLWRQDSVKNTDPSIHLSSVNPVSLLIRTRYHSGIVPQSSISNTKLNSDMCQLVCVYLVG